MASPETTRKYLSVAGACVTQFTVIGILISYGLFFKAFEEEFGWSRATLSAANSLAFLVMGVMAIYAGRLNDRFGPKVVLSVSGAVYGVGVMLIALIGAPWQLLVLFSSLIALGISTHDVVTLSTIARWFDRRRGLMTGVVKTGTAVGQVAVPPITAYLILTAGWREAALLLGAAAFVLLILAARAMSVPQDGATDAAPKTGATYQEARASRVFWTMMAMQFLFFGTLTTVPLHIVPHSVDLGMALERSALLISTMGAASVAGRLTVGAFSDRLGGRNGYLLCLTPICAALALLVLVRDPGVLFLVMALYGFGHGGCFTVVSPTVAQMFGTRAHGAIFGVILFAGTISGAAAPMLAGAVFDWTASYDLAFGGLCLMLLIALGLSLTLPGTGAPGDGN